MFIESVKCVYFLYNSCIYCCGTRRIWWSGSVRQNLLPIARPTQMGVAPRRWLCICAQGERGKGLGGCRADWSLVGAIRHPSIPSCRPRSALAGGEPGQGRAWHWPPADFLCSGTPADLGALIYGYSARRLSYLVFACTRALDMAKSVVSPKSSDFYPSKFIILLFLKTVKF